MSLIDDDGVPGDGGQGGLVGLGHDHLPRRDQNMKLVQVPDIYMYIYMYVCVCIYEYAHTKIKKMDFVRLEEVAGL